MDLGVIDANASIAAAIQLAEDVFYSSHIVNIVGPEYSLGPLNFLIDRTNNLDAITNKLYDHFVDHVVYAMLAKDWAMSSVSSASATSQDPG